MGGKSLFPIDVLLVMMVIEAAFDWNVVAGWLALTAVGWGLLFGFLRPPDEKG
jgi:hypothetical protein